jgi:hypothetical protein
MIQSALLATYSFIRRQPAALNHLAEAVLSIHQPELIEAVKL